MLLQQVLGLSNEAIDMSCKKISAPVHHKLVEPLFELQKLACNAGFDLQVASGWRSFDRQLSIWNQKASGNAVVLDNNEVALDIRNIGEEALIRAILRWSALPGGSRHHWGSEVDVFDKKAMPLDYKLQLTQGETVKGAVFYEFHQWLSDELSKPSSCFFRPYAEDKGGVSPEPWHLSYKPLAQEFEQALSFDALYELIADSNMELKDTVLGMFDEIWQRFVLLC